MNEDHTCPEISVDHCARCLCRTPDIADRVDLVSAGAGTVRAICVECLSEIGANWPWDPRDPSELWDRPEIDLSRGDDPADWWKGSSA